MMDFLIIMFFLSQAIASIAAACMFTIAIDRSEFSILTILVCIYGIVGTLFACAVFLFLWLSLLIEDSRFWKFLTKKRSIK